MRWQYFALEDLSMPSRSPRSSGLGKSCVVILVFLGSVWGISRWMHSRGKTHVQAAPDVARSIEDQVNEALGLHASSVATLTLAATPAATRSPVIQLGDESYTLDLRLHSVRSASYRVLIQQADGSLEDAVPGEIHTYRGRLAEVEGSVAAATVTPHGLHARIILPDGDEYWVEPVTSQVPGAGRDAHAIYRTDDVIPTTSKCDAHAVMRMGAQPDGVALAGEVACGSGLCIAEIACDTDVEYYEHWGSATSVEDRINAVINAVNIHYERDVNIRHLISAIVIRTVEPDPYNSLDALTMLNEFRGEWQANRGHIQRDAAQLFTGKQVAGNTIGIAWLSGVCGSYGYSMVQSDFNGNFSCATDLSAHELGHNWSADHCDCASGPTYTMNPYITCANQFHPSLTIPEIESYRDGLGCLTAGAVCSIDADCNDDLFCTGVEHCSGGVCGSDGDPCPGEDCDEESDTCVPRICNDNGVCDGEEDCVNCPGDCVTGSGSMCGNGVCETGAGESCLTCSQDCHGMQNGKPGNRYCCGGEGYNPVTCDDSRCTADGRACTDAPGVPSCCGDGVCEGVEDACSCALDCGAGPSFESNCTDGIDEDCDGTSDCTDTDCATDPACKTLVDCGNGVCDTGEDCVSCAADCPGKQTGRKSERFCCGDGVDDGVEIQDPTLCKGNN